MLRAATKRPVAATARLLHCTAAVRLSAGGAEAATAASQLRAPSRLDFHGNGSPNDGGANFIGSSCFSYGRMLFRAAERGQTLTRSERQSVLLAQAAVAAASTPPRQQKRFIKSSASAAAAQLPRNSTSSPLSPHLGPHIAAAAAVGCYSVGQDVVSARGQRTRAQRLSQVQRFLEATRSSSGGGTGVGDQNNDADSPAPAQYEHGGGVLGQVGFSARHKPGHSWSALAGRPVFSYGQFIAQQAQQVDTRVAWRVSARQAALRQFLDSTA